ncbi:MAG: hypothetical protein VXU42_03575 [Verrucomicrobiota bacterium]|nr:hypothetical protein [Verrucomicrobiota bacterium]
MYSDFHELWQKLPVGLQGVPGDFFKQDKYGLFKLLAKKMDKPFTKWIEDWTRLDDMRPPGTDSAFADEEEFMGRLKTQYSTWYAQQGGDGKERIKKTTTIPGTTEEAKAMVKNFMAYVPCDESIMHLKAEDGYTPPSTKSETARMSLTRSIVMSLMYAALTWKPEIVFHVVTLTRYNVYPSEKVYVLALQILKYCIRTKYLGIGYSPGDDMITGGSSDVPDGWCDASWVVREPMKMFTDNRAAVFIGEDAAAVRKSKADSRHAIFLQETVEEGIMELKHWPGKGNVADIGTKWLNRHDFEKYRAVLINMHAHRKLSIPVP